MLGLKWNHISQKGSVGSNLTYAEFGVVQMYVLLYYTAPPFVRNVVN